MSSRNDIAQKWRDFETQFTAFCQEFRNSTEDDPNVALTRLYSLSIVCENTRLFLKLRGLTERHFATEVKWIDDYIKAFNKCHEESDAPQLQVPEPYQHGWKQLCVSWRALFRAMWGSPCISLASAFNGSSRGRMGRRVSCWNRKMDELSEDMRRCYPEFGQFSRPQSCRSFHGSTMVSRPPFYLIGDDGTIPEHPGPTYEQVTQDRKSSLYATTCTYRDGATNTTPQSR